MKRALAMTLALAFGSAQAGQILLCANKMNTLMVATDEKVPECAVNSRLFYTTSNEGQVLRGCWDFAYGKLHVRWSDGTEYMYNVEACKLGDAGEEMMRKSKADGPQT